MAGVACALPYAWAHFMAYRVAKVEQITAGSRYVMSDEVGPKRVVPQISSLNGVAKKPPTITRPYESVSVIRLKGK
jgi:alpha-N-arabinofuranosidase